MFNTLASLKTDPTFLKLDRLQSMLDTADDVILKADFTRSPFQLLSFLITYAGLETDKRQYVINQLNTLSKDQNPLITKEELDNLIALVDWASLLKKDPHSALVFQFTVSLSKPEFLYDGIKRNYPSLLTILQSDECIIKIDKADKVIFFTQVEQKVSWMDAFKITSSAICWRVHPSSFEMSEKLSAIVKTMAVSSTKTVGGFSIRKGNCDTVKLYINTPRNHDSSNEYRSETKALKVNSGIYRAFQGICGFYGLSRVDDVVVKLSNNATFSEIGATASQSQKVGYATRGGFGGYSGPIIPTEVIIKAPLNVYYQGIDIMACLGEDKTDVSSLKGSDDNGNYITLRTKEADTGIRLYPRKLTPIEMHGLNFGVDISAAKKIALLRGMSAPVTPKSKLKSQELSSLLNDAQVQFNEKVELLAQKMQEFSSNPALIHKFNAAKKLYTALKTAGDAYFLQPQTHDSYAQFKRTCDIEIGVARRVLNTHTNLRKILLNIVAIVATAGIGYAIAAGINIAINKKFTFFSTDSSLKIDLIEKSIQQSALTA